MLELKQITFRAPKSKTPILDCISLCIKPGALTVITGPNGSGKSTLAKIIMGLVAPTAGRVIFCGEDITECDLTARAKNGIGFAFQTPVKFKGLTVYELLNIANGELFSPEEAGNILKQVGLAPDEYLGREVGAKLSGGELKRVEIATVLARKDTKLLLFDEPEAGIDLWSFKNLTTVFKKIRQAHPEKSLVIISHQEKILELADEIIILKDGRVKSRGAPAEILPELGADK